MKVLKALAVAIGLVGLIVASVILFRGYLSMRDLVSAANANRSQNLMTNPIDRVALAFGLGILGGLLVGVGLGLPLRGEGAGRKQALRSAEHEDHHEGGPLLIGDDEQHEPAVKPRRGV